MGQRGGRAFPTPTQTGWVDRGRDPRASSLSPGSACATCTLTLDAFVWCFIIFGKLEPDNIQTCTVCRTPVFEKHCNEGPPDTPKKPVEAKPGHAAWELPRAPLPRHRRLVGRILACASHSPQPPAHQEHIRAQDTSAKHSLAQHACTQSARTKCTCTQCTCAERSYPV